MSLYSEVLKQVHNCTENCKHSEPAAEKQPTRVQHKMRINKDEHQEEPLTDSYEYYGCFESLSTKAQKLCSTGSAKISPIRKKKLADSQQTILKDQEFNISNSVPTDKSSKSSTKIIKKKKTTGRVWIFAQEYSVFSQYELKNCVKKPDMLRDFQKKSENCERVVYLTWSLDCCLEYSPYFIDELYSGKYTYSYRVAHYGMNPSCISKWIYDNNMQDKNINLWIVTSGEVTHKTVSACKELNNGLNFESLNIVTINRKKIDNSVALCFMSPDCYQINLHEIYDDGQNHICIKNKYYQKIKYSNFLKEYENLLEYVVCMYTINYKELQLKATENPIVKDKEVDNFVKFLEMKRTKMISTYHELNKCLSNANDNCNTFDKIIARKIDSIINFIQNPANNLSLSITELKNQIMENEQCDKLESIVPNL